MTPREPGRRRTFAAAVSQNRAGDPFYSSARWRALRRAVLIRDGWQCVQCGREGRLSAANEVDHVLPRDAQPELEWEMQNLQSLCKPCHSAKTGGERQVQARGPK